MLERIKNLLHMNSRPPEEVGAGELRTVRVGAGEDEGDQDTGIFQIIMEDKITRNMVILLFALLVVLFFGIWIYGRVNLHTEIEITRSVGETDIAGTHYAMLDNHVIKYSTDGLFVTDTSGKTGWSIAYGIQTPIAACRGSRMALAEQLGKQIIVLNKSGVIGQFQTDLKIRRIALAENGVTGAVLEDGEITRIKLYDTQGQELVEIKTTMDMTGYPVDIALSKDAKRMMVSYLGEQNGQLVSRIVFYDFSSAQDADGDHITAEYSYSREVFPRVFYTDDGVPAAVGDDCILVFSKGRKPEEAVRVDEDREIVSVFYDDESIGMIFHSESTEARYEMEVYNYKGKKMMQTSFAFEYTGVCLENGEIVLYDERDLYIYRTSGKQKFSYQYDKPVRFFTRLSGAGKYLVITDDSLDTIKLR